MKKSCIVIFINILINYKKIILSSFILTCSLTFITIQILPQWYKATTTFVSMDVSKSKHSRAVSLWWDIQVNIIAQLPVLNYSNDYIAYLNSETIMRNIIKKYDD